MIWNYSTLLTQPRLSHHPTTPELPTEITIEIAEAPILPCSTAGDKTVKRTLIDGPPYHQEVCPGSSIGYCLSSSLELRQSSGSIGAFFEATQESGETTKFLLTNHHVAYPNKSDKVLSKFSGVLLSPSPEDLIATQQSDEGYVLYLKEQIELIENRNQVQLSIEAQQAGIAKARELREEIKQYEEFISNLGPKSEVERMLWETVVGPSESASTYMSHCWNTVLDWVPFLPKRGTSTWAVAKRGPSSGQRSDGNNNEMDWAVATLLKNLPDANMVSL